MAERDYIDYEQESVLEDDFADFEDYSAFLEDDSEDINSGESIEQGETGQTENSINESFKVESVSQQKEDKEKHLQSNLFKGNKQLYYTLNRGSKFANQQGHYIGEGSTGDYVILIQKALNLIFKDDPTYKPLVEEKDFGPKTKAAVIKFQDEYGLKDAKGVVGSETIHKLDQEVVILENIKEEQRDEEKGKEKEEYHTPKGDIIYFPENITNPKFSETRNKQLSTLIEFELNGHKYRAKYKDNNFVGYINNDGAYYDFSVTQKDVLSSTGALITVLSLTTSSIEKLGGLDEAQKLIESGKFQMKYDGRTNTYSLKFHGNQHVEAEVVKVAKSTFQQTATKGNALFKFVKGTGLLLNFAGLLVSINQAYNEYVSKGEVSTGTTIDIIMGGVAFIPGGGWIVSGVYFIGKETLSSLHEANKSYVKKKKAEGKNYMTDTYSRVGIGYWLGWFD